MESEAKSTESNPAPTISLEQAAGLGAISSIASLLAGIVRAKVVASVLGPAALGISSEISQLVSLANTGTAAFAGPGLIRAVAEGKKANDRTKVEKAFGAAIFLSGVVSVVCGALAVLISAWVLPETVAPIARPLVALGCFGTALTVVLFAVTQTSAAAGKIRNSTVITLVQVLAGVASAIPLTWLFGLTGQFASFALAPLLVVPLALAVLRKSGVVSSVIQYVRFDARFMKDGLKLGGASLAVGIGAQVAVATIRVVLETVHGGPAWNGQFQAAWALANSYLGVILSGVGSYVFPRFSVVSNQELGPETTNAARFILRIAPPIILVAICVREVALLVLYDHRFLEAGDILGFQFAADIARSLAWIYTGPLLYRNKTRAYLFVEFSALLILAIATILLVPRYGLRGVGFAYLLCSVSYLMLTWFACRFSFDTELSWRPLVLALALTTLALCVNQWWPRNPLSMAIAIGVAIVWLFLNGSLRFLTNGFRQRFAGMRS